MTFGSALIHAAGAWGGGLVGGLVGAVVIKSAGGEKNPVAIAAGVGASIVGMALGIFVASKLAR